MQFTIPFLLASGALALTPPLQLIPDLGGAFSVSNVVLPLTDTSRRDPYNTTQARRVLLSLYLPVPAGVTCHSQSVSYMTPAVVAWYNQYVASFGLPGNLFDHLGLQFCESVQQPARKCRGQFPTVLYSPGLGNSRLIYGARARSLASQGYVVVTVDHPYDAAVVEFPDGSVVLGANIDDDDEVQLAKAVTVRAADLSFVVSQLNNKTLMDALLSAHPARPNTRQVIAIGHSIGGTASFAAANNNSRIHGAGDFDGRFVEPFQSQPYHKPGMLVGRPDHKANDPTWDEAWPYLRGKKAELRINSTQHGTFEDFPTLVPVFNLPDAAKQALVPLLGSISWQDMDRDVNGLVAAFVDLVFRGENHELAEIETKYPNITIVRADV